MDVFITEATSCNARMSRLVLIMSLKVLEWEIHLKLNVLSVTKVWLVQM